VCARREGSPFKRTEKYSSVGSDNEQPKNVAPARTPWLENIEKLIKAFELPGLDIEAIVVWQRKDMEALSEANKQFCDDIEAIVERRDQLLRETSAQWQAAMNHVEAPEAITKEAVAGNLGVERTTVIFRELAELEAQACSRAWKTVHARMQENLSNLLEMLSAKSRY
jgi:hypothetical protein